MIRIKKSLVFMCAALWASALSAQTHFTFDFHQYQYDMTVYYTLVAPDGNPISETGNYEVAAFVNDECRGVGKLVTQTGENGQTLTYGYLRVYSNETSGETITFKYYDKETEEEKVIEDVTVPFVATSLEGMPTEPKKLPIDGVAILIGDVNGDGSISVTDVGMTISFILGQNPVGFNEDAADLNGDGTISVTDVGALITKILTGN